MDKPVGPTSHDVVDDVRERLGVRRVGHTGTLDPFASGVLVLCVGAATRLARFIEAADKEYVAELVLGETTDTIDPTGELVARQDCSELSGEAVRQAAASFLGEFEQIPPRFSAVKVGGQRAYAKARRGEDFERKGRLVRVSSLEVTGFEPGPAARATLAIACSKGFYVRALARDLGQALSCPAMLAKLRRTRVGGFGQDRCLSLADLGSGDEARKRLLAMEAAVEALPKLELGPSEAARISSGQSIQQETANNGVEVALTVGGRLVAVGIADGGRIKPKVVLGSGVLR